MSDSSKEVAVAVVEWNDRFLIGQRPAGIPLAGYWEFPGGKLEATETAEVAAVRECLEETGLAVHVVGRYSSVEHTYSHGQLRLHFLACHPHEPARVPKHPYRWVARSELAAYRFPEANGGLIAELSERPDDGRSLAFRPEGR